MEDLIKFVSEKAGLTPDQAKAAVEAAGTYLKDRVPAIKDHVSNFMEGKGIGGMAGMASGIKDKLGL